MSVTEHDTHVAGGVARWAGPTGWRATYGETPRLTRKQLVDQAKARLAGTSAFAPSTEVEKQEALEPIATEMATIAPAAAAKAVATATGPDRAAMANSRPRSTSRVGRPRTDHAGAAAPRAFK